MRMTDLILKKRGGEPLLTGEIQWMVEQFVAGNIPDYQMSAMLMAICFQDMDDRETLDLTMAMVHSGDTIDLSGVEGITADKHSTGGVGDKTSLVLCPLMAACGVKMPKMSGRGLGHTGGTLDKLESFFGFTSAIGKKRFIEIVNQVGFAIAGQTGVICPADKKLYALRDVTGTVSSQPLIVSSIMSKKLAAGADVIVLDVKTGSGAFMRTEEEAFALAERMVRVGRSAGKKVVAVITDMDQPLGCAVGNALEVAEAVETLKGRGEPELLELCYTLGSEILVQSGAAENEEQARAQMKTAISSGAALERFAAFVKAQGGDSEQVENTALLPRAPIQYEVLAEQNAYIAGMDAEAIGRICAHLGGGREVKESEIDLSVGLVLNKKVGDYAAAGELLATVYALSMAGAKEAEQALLESLHFQSEPVSKRKFIKGIVR